MKTVDLNCDLGEGMTADEQLIPLISSANIACGYHAGNPAIMRSTIQLCMKHNVAIGAHPSWPDLNNFGRTEQTKLPAEIYTIVSDQLCLLATIAKEEGTSLHHIKPHGALYNQSAKDPLIAKAIANAVHDFDSELILFGLSGSCSIHEAEQMRLLVANEVFADRTYQDNGSLTPRAVAGALIEVDTVAAAQALQLVSHQTVTTITGKTIPLKADTICLHGDGTHALSFANHLLTTFKQAGFDIKKY